MTMTNLSQSGKAPTSLKALMRLRKQQSAELQASRHEVARRRAALNEAIHRRLTSPAAFGLSFASGMGIGYLARRGRSRRPDTQQGPALLQNPVIKSVLRIGAIRMGTQAVQTLLG